MSFRLYDSRTRTTSDFTPLVEGRVSIYHCGLTVQSSPHLGHIRKEVVFDVLRRWLTDSGYQVSIVANVTDIDDKILAKSAERGVPWYAHAYEFERELHEAYGSLGCALPTYEPRATGHIPEMVELIGELIEAGHAYPAPDGSGDVYFDVRSWPEYGELSHMAIDDMEPAADAEPRGKKDPRDFALWKGHKDGEPETASWPSPWGRGRPGWHIECSAMAGKYLGDSFDIHGGGIDLRFPHHENELAQSRAAGRGFARYWMHNAWVTAAGEKMSKSLSNGALVKDVTRQYPARAVRLYLLQPHYRSTIEYSQTSLAEATAQLARLDGFLDRAASATDGADLGGELLVLPDAFTRAMDDDLGTPQAVAVLFNLVKEGNQTLEQGGDVRPVLGQVYAILDVLGLDPRSEQWAGEGGGDQQLRPVVDGLVQALLDQRADARGRRDWAAADAIRDRLAELGLKVEDTPNGARWSLEARADKGTSGAGQEA